MTYKAEIPYGAYWSTPFTRWQGSFAGLNSVEFAAYVARKELAKRKIDPKQFDYGVLGFSVPQKHSFYGLPWLTGLMGAEQATGPTVMQACATGVRTLLSAAQEIEVGMASKALVVNCDRTSNGPHLYYPNPRGPGGTGTAEDWVMDNFGCDPLGGHSMLKTAENVAAKHGITTAQQHAQRLGFVQFFKQIVKVCHVGNSHVGDGQNHVALTQATLRSRVRGAIHQHAALDFEVFLLSIGQVADHQT